MPDKIVSAAIYPPIGVCRVGNSPDGYYIGPEVPHPAPLKPGSYRDAKGRLKREAARFRIYGLNAAGQPVRELTAHDAKIEWHVEVANQKSSWYEFQLALDIPEAAQAPATLRRNASIPDRASLTISPGARSISGCDTHGAKFVFDGGKFAGIPVPLGELRTDEAGRLLVLGGNGKSGSIDDKLANTFANNEGWYDDTSDGPVHARVSLDGKDLPVDPAWVICAPPNYGPQQKSVRTMWDLMYDVETAAGRLDVPTTPSFTQDIRPVFERMSNLQWVNQAFLAGFGHGSAMDFSAPDFMARLNDKSTENAEFRRILANNFRVFDIDGWSPVPWPWMYGDAMNIPAAKTPRQNAVLTDLQLFQLHQWATGNFHDDHAAGDPPRRIEDYPLADQPATLTRAAMEFCLADAFHPGCEMTWPMRHAGMYAKPFRIKARPKGDPEPNFGSQLFPEVALSIDGPVRGGQSPGSITRWMAIPWQTDTSSCRSGYEPNYDPYIPTFWPARVPNEVLSTNAYKLVMDKTADRAKRLAAFANRANWLEPLGLKRPYIHQINHMIHHFDQMGVVEVQPGLKNDPDFPASMQVSDQQPTDALIASAAAAPQTAAMAKIKALDDTGPADLTRIDKVRRLTHSS